MGKLAYWNKVSCAWVLRQERDVARCVRKSIRHASGAMVQVKVSRTLEHG
jgi:hypothetical protein